MVNKNDFRFTIPSQPVTKHSYIPLVQKRSASKVVVASYLKKLFFFLIPHTKLVGPKKPSKMVKKNDYRNPVPSEPVTSKHSYIPLVHKRRASKVVVAR